MNRGFVLMNTILVLTALSSLAIRQARSDLFAYHSAHLGQRRVQAVHAAQSGIEIGRRILELDESSIDGPGDPWYSPAQFKIGTIPVNVLIEDEQAKLNVNHLVYPSGELNPGLWRIFARLMSGTPITRIDWLRFMRNRQQQTRSRLPAPGLIRLVEGLSSVPVPEDLTVFGNGRININTAGPGLLSAILGNPGKDVVAEIIAERERQAFISVFELAARTHLADTDIRKLIPIGTVRSSFYKITAKSVSSPVTVTVETLIRRTGPSTEILQYREW